jgi:hypothetical protein
MRKSILKCCKNILFRVNRIVRFFGVKILGALIFSLGVIGLFLPLLQGIAMMILGLAMMGNRSAANALKGMKIKLKYIFSKN